MQPVLRRQYEMAEELNRTDPIIGITNCFGFGMLLAQDKLGIPVITCHLQPSVLWSDDQPPVLAGVVGPRWLRRLSFRIGERFFIDPVVCPFLNAWRHELGLPPVRKIVRWWNSRFAVLCMFPGWYAPRQADWPDQVLQTDFPLWNDASNIPLANDVCSFLDDGEAPIVFTPGTANRHAQKFFQAAIDACMNLGRRGLLLTSFQEQLPRELPSSIASFSYVRWISYFRGRPHLSITAESVRHRKQCVRPLPSCSCRWPMINSTTPTVLVISTSATHFRRPFYRLSVDCETCALDRIAASQRGLPLDRYATEARRRTESVRRRNPQANRLIPEPPFHTSAAGR